MRRFLGTELAQHHDDGLQNIERLEAGDGNRLVFVFRDPLIGAAADDRGHVARPDEGVEPHVGRIENGADRGNDRDVIAEHRKIVDALRLRAHQRQCRGGSRGFKADGEKHHVLVGIGLRQFQRVGRRIDDAHIHPARFVFERAAVRARNAHHVAKGGEDDVGLLGDREPVVDSAHRQHAHRAARAVDQVDIGGQQILQPEAIDGVGVSAANFHDAVVPVGIGQPADFFGGPADDFRFAKLVDKFHARCRRILYCVSRFSSP